MATVPLPIAGLPRELRKKGLLWHYIVQLIKSLITCFIFPTYWYGTVLFREYIWRPSRFYIVVFNVNTDRLFHCIYLVSALASMIEADAKVKKCVADLVEGTASIRLLAHRNQVGAVIGKAGALIKETIAETSCRVHVSQEPLPGSTEKTVVIHFRIKQSNIHNTRTQAAHGT